MKRNFLNLISILNNNSHCIFYIYPSCRKLSEISRVKDTNRIERDRTWLVRRFGTGQSQTSRMESPSVIAASRRLAVSRSCCSAIFSRLRSESRAPGTIADVFRVALDARRVVDIARGRSTDADIANIPNSRSQSSIAQSSLRSVATKTRPVRNCRQIYTRASHMAVISRIASSDSIRI